MKRAGHSGIFGAGAIAAAALFVDVTPVAAQEPVSSAKCEYIYKPNLADAVIASCDALIASGVTGRALADALTYRGTAYRRKGDYDRALTDSKDALTIDPNLPDALNSLAVVYWRNSDTEMAMETLNKALQIDPASYRVLVNRSTLFRIKKDYESATRDLDEAIRLAPTFPVSFVLRAFVRSAQAEYAGAIADLDEAIRFDPDADYYRWRGRFNEELKNRDRMIADYKIAIELDPKHANAHYDLGRAYYAENNYDLAITEYSTAIALNPKFANAHSALGSVYVVKEDWVQAIHAYSAAIAFEPELRTIALAEMPIPGAAIIAMLSRTMTKLFFWIRSWRPHITIARG